MRWFRRIGRQDAQAEAHQVLVEPLETLLDKLAATAVDRVHLASLEVRGVELLEGAARI
jgi:hypothetical protein